MLNIKRYKTACRTLSVFYVYENVHVKITRKKTKDVNSNY